MILEDLNRCFYLVDELHKADALIDSLWNAAHPGGQVMTGMPHTPGVKDKVGDLAIEIGDLETEREKLRKLVEEAAKQIEPFIAGIPDLQTRTIFRLRFLRGLAWKEVARVVGGYNSERGVKNACYRYLKKTCGEE